MQGKNDMYEHDPEEWAAECERGRQQRQPRLPEADRGSPPSTGPAPVVDAKLIEDAPPMDPETQVLLADFAGVAPEGPDASDPTHLSLVFYVADGTKLMAAADLRTAQEVDDVIDLLLSVRATVWPSKYRMEAALRMVLMAHDKSPWTVEKHQVWHGLQIQAGVKDPRPDITVRTLVDTVRHVLDPKGK